MLSRNQTSTKWGRKVFLQLGRICFSILLRQSENFSDFCKVLSQFAFRNMIVPLPKSQARHPARARTPLHLPHMLFWHDKTLQTSPPVRNFSSAYEVAQSPHENNMSETTTRSVLARFCDNNWEKGKDFVKTFYVKKPVWEMEGNASARWMTCLGFRWRYDHVAKSKLRLNFARVAKILRLSQKYWKTNSAKL